MKIALVSATIVVMSTASAFACMGNKQQEVMSCMEGTQFDVESGTCIPVVNS